jgi:hypothetical protein
LHLPQLLWLKVVKAVICWRCPCLQLKMQQELSQVLLLSGGKVA